MRRNAHNLQKRGRCRAFMANGPVRLWHLRTAKSRCVQAKTPIFGAARCRQATAMCAETVASRLCSHGQATCSLRPPALPLPTLVRARILPKLYPSPYAARYYQLASSKLIAAYSNANTGFRRSGRYSCTGTSAETDATLSSLQADLAAAVSAEDYSTAALLRDELT